MFAVVFHGEMSRQTFELEDHKPVAVINVGNRAGHLDALEYAYEMTQNIMGSWSMDYEGNPQDRTGIAVVEPLYEDPTGKKWGHRSSMVGDRIALISGPDIDHAQYDATYVVDSFGFKRL